MRLFQGKLSLRDFVVWVLFGLCGIFLACAISITRNPGDIGSAAHKMEKMLDRKVSVLEEFSRKALSLPEDAWMSLKGLPEDMVVYRYVNDSLQSWAHRFTVSNDDISNRIVYQRFTNPRYELNSPLIQVDENIRFLNLGTKWYLTRCITEGNCKVVSGLEVPGIFGKRYAVHPLSYSGGVAVRVNGEAKFKLICDSVQTYLTSDSILIWAALVMFISGALLFLANKRTISRLRTVLTGIFVTMGAIYLWGLNEQNEARIFSPSLYADNGFMYSLGAVIIVNMTIMVAVYCLYIVRLDLLRWLKKKSGSGRVTLCSIGIIVAILGIFSYTFFTFRSIAVNSNISLELHKLRSLSGYTAMVYASFTGLLLSVPLLVQMLRPGMKQWFGIRYNSMSNQARMLFSVVFSLYLVVLSSVFGFQKEQDRINVWANRLSIDRDLGLEIQLKSVESSISDDMLISSLSFLPNSNSTILNRITDTYLYRISQDYDLSVYTIQEDNFSKEAAEFFRNRVRGGMPIAEESRFMYSEAPGGQAFYTGIFSYFNPHYGVAKLLIGIEPKSDERNRGYYSLLGYAAPGKVVIPPMYSYARYKNGDLILYRGNFAYPTRLERIPGSDLAEGESRHFISSSFSHFEKRITEDETVILSRPSLSASAYLVSLIFAALIFFLLLSLMYAAETSTATKEKKYYKSRVTSVLIFSLVLTLIALGLVSIIFVYRRNDDNMKSLMSDKVTSIQALLEDHYRNSSDFRDLTGSVYADDLETVSNITKADITLYTPNGKAFESTVPELFDKMIVGTRMNEIAYENVIFKGKRYFINREKLGEKSFYSLYAPIFNSEGKMIALFCSPYTDQNFNFRMEAVSHSVTILCVFLILLIVARIMIGKIVDNMFEPLTEMSRKMSATNVDGLEYIRYDNDDEITSLVTSYNRMIRDLSESTRQLAQAERDKAWSSMARQVAHEIKNPLTPMKLQLQRIIRLKQKNAPDWQDKFDEVAKIVLDHIDILTDTANEFSTFAKLYTEEPVEIDLDKVLQDEISMFDNRNGIIFSYVGFTGTKVTGPKPQLTRVFVNLINNAVQAVEENGGGQIRISLRNSTRDGFYDIVFEDDGKGVDSENTGKLFTPYFTTKTGGTGLGLAISRSILEKCAATISYSRSFSLGGACFTIQYPKN